MSNTFKKAEMTVQSGNGRTDGNGAYIKDMSEKAFSGTVYAVVGASGWAGGTAKPHPVMYMSNNVMGSLVMDFNGDTLDVKYIDRSGARRDYLTIKKKGLSSKPSPTPDPEPTPDPKPTTPVPTPNKAPIATIVSPSSNTSLVAPASIKIDASASDSDGTISKVEFLAGGKVLGSDTSAPYSYTWNNVPEGAQSITVRAIDSDGATATSGSVLVNVTSAPKAPEATQTVTGFTLINASTNQPVPGYENIANGATFVRANLPANLSIRANTNPGVVGSVKFSWKGNASYRTETEAPYALFGGKGSDDYVPGTIANGAHTIKATPYTLGSAKGTAGQSLTVSFTIVDTVSKPSTPPPSVPAPTVPEPEEEEPAAELDRVTSFSLINANTNQPIAGYETITPGMVISRASLPTTKLSVRANTNVIVGSVKFGWNSNSSYRIESEAPYALFGGNGSDDYAPGTIANGTHTMKATPYSLAKGKGTVGQSLQITFSIK
jgi:hypothetical protein